MIRIERLHITRFRGILNLELNINQRNFAVSGPNGTGKSGVVLFPIAPDFSPGLVGCFDETDELEIFSGYYARVREMLEVNDLFPESTAEEDDRKFMLLLGLSQEFLLCELLPMLKPTGVVPHPPNAVALGAAHILSSFLTLEVGHASIDGYGPG